MFIRRPKITRNQEASGIDLLRDAMAQYGVIIAADEGSRELQSLRMDDIDLVEAIQLVEEFTGAKVDRKMLQPSTTIEEIAQTIDQNRSRSQNRN